MEKAPESLLDRDIPKCTLLPCTNRSQEVVHNMLDVVLQNYMIGTPNHRSIFKDGASQAPQNRDCSCNETKYLIGSRTLLCTRTSGFGDCDKHTRKSRDMVSRLALRVVWDRVV